MVDMWKDDTLICYVNHGVDGHEYVDIRLESTDCKPYRRVVVDISFRQQFEIAKPTPTYQRMVNMLPDTYIGHGGTALQRLVCLMCNAAKVSLESHGMAVPPWRKLAFMHAKWFAPHSRSRVTGTRELVDDGQHALQQSRILLPLIIEPSPRPRPRRHPNSPGALSLALLKHSSNYKPNITC